MVLKRINRVNVLSFATYLFAFSFALTPFFSSISLLFFTISSLFIIKIKRLNKLERVFTFCYSSLFILYAFGMLWTNFIPRATELLIRILPILVLPLLIAYGEIYKKINYDKFKEVFILGVLISCVISLTYGIYRYTIDQNFDHLLYFDFGSLMHLHPSYYSLYIITALVFLYRTKINLALSYKIIIYLILAICIFLLQSKISILIFFLLLVIATLSSIKKKRYKISALFFLTLLVLAVTGLNYGENRLNELFKKRDSKDIGSFKEDGVSQRIWLWNTALDHIKDRPFFGYGLGSREKIFKWKVEKSILMNDYSPAYSQAIKSISKFNLHNNYLQILYELGIVGLAFFLFMCIRIIILGFLQKKWTFLSIYGVFLLFLFVEVALNRQMGIYFYAFILPMLFYQDEHIYIETQKSSNNSIM